MSNAENLITLVIYNDESINAFELLLGIKGVLYQIFFKFFNCLLHLAFKIIKIVLSFF